ncbi:MAG: T9SS type A sorting domain-containing protein [Bacteroidetes bacterium]|nr:T9SS type A sorting domain-containing protein [Bacteroidota bacterium]
MTPKILLPFLLILISFSANAQKYGNTWYFGDKAGMHFNNCNPIPVTTSNIDGFEGCATYNDTSGQVLFYTNGEKVWNRLNNVMPNGQISSSGSTKSQTIIIPFPGSDSLYYIITTCIQGQPASVSEFHIVDMSLNNGNGDVSSKNNLLTTAVATEQVAATYHANGTDIWLVLHEYLTNNFLVFHVTPAGIPAFPQYYPVGTGLLPCSSNMNARGQIKFSPDGSKLAINGNGVGNDILSNLLTLYDFDINTGVVSNPIDLPFSRGDFSLSFSPDNTKLYGATWKAFNFTASDYNILYQFDLSSGVPSTIINSKVILDSIPIPQSFGDMKLGPDGRIYIARNNSDFLDVIRFPNVAGAGCTYVEYDFHLGGKTSTFGLNNYIEYRNYCDNTVAVNEVNGKVKPQLYPNPVNSLTHLKLNVVVADATISISNSTGQLVKQLSQLNGSELKIDCAGLIPGFYVMQLHEKGRLLTTEKLVVIGD